MAVFTASSRSTLVGVSGVTPQLFGFRVGAQVAKMLAIHIFSQTAPTTSGGLGLYRSTADGATFTGQVTGMALSPQDAATTGFVWTGATTLPTIGANALMRWAHPASLGNGIIWSFDLINPLFVTTTAATGNLVVANLNTTAPGTFDFTFVWEE